MRLWKRDIQAALFWGCIVVLLSASVFFGVSADRIRRGMLGNGGKISSGDIVTLESVIDGDTVTVSLEGQPSAVIRILGIKSFESKIEKDDAAPYGKAAADTLQRLTTGHTVRVLLHSTPKDRYGRYLATLYVNDLDIGLHLVKEGLALVYTVYPFPAMSFYLQEQELARAGRRGLWANTDVSSRAMALIREWQGRSP